MTTASLCRLHPDRPALGTCERCGSFGCADCLVLTGQQRLCPDCRARATTELPPLVPRADLARLGLFATGAVGLLLSLLELAVGGQLETGNPDEPSLLVVLFGLVGLGYLAVFIGTIVVFLRWFHLVARYALARGVTLDATPGWAVGYWFVPIVNLFRPFQLARAMLSGLGANAGLVGAWQATWIIGNGLANVSSRLDSAPVSLLSGLVMVGASITGVQVISALTRAAAGEKS